MLARSAVRNKISTDQHVRTLLIDTVQPISTCTNLIPNLTARQTFPVPFTSVVAGRSNFSDQNGG
ncbi:MAG TPA: hypothetical protein DDZ51_13805 [Planctomycetaceae bacterium]|nr:hypothetical protein [Planctomycetaceae bacterium]